MLRGKWEKLEGKFCLQNKPKRVVFYLEGPSAGVDLLIESVAICCDSEVNLVLLTLPSPCLFFLFFN